MILYLALAVILALVPYPPPVRRFAIYLCLVLAALFGFAGTSMIVTYGLDGLLMGSLFLVLGVGLLLRVYWMKRPAKLAH